jgi:predicted cobalt transporter CbtA
VGVFLIPFLKYPASPPSVGNADTIGRRTALYFLLIAVGLLAIALAVVLQRRFAPALGGWNATLLSAAVFAGVVALSYLIMPGIDEVPAGFPPSVLWKFRLASVGTQLVMWGVLGLSFGAATERRESAIGRLAATRPGTASAGKHDASTS